MAQHSGNRLCFPGSVYEMRVPISSKRPDAKRLHVEISNYVNICIYYPKFAYYSYYNVITMRQHCNATSHTIGFHFVKKTCSPSDYD